MGAWEERGADQEERRGTGRDLPTQSQKEESRVGAGGCGETALTFINVPALNLAVCTLRSATPSHRATSTSRSQTASVMLRARGGF